MRHLQRSWFLNSRTSGCPSSVSETQTSVLYPDRDLNSQRIRTVDCPRKRRGISAFDKESLCDGYLVQSWVDTIMPFPQHLSPQSLNQNPLFSGCMLHHIFALPNLLAKAAKGQVVRQNCAGAEVGSSIGLPTAKVAYADREYSEARGTLRSTGKLHIVSEINGTWQQPWLYRELWTCNLAMLPSCDGHLPVLLSQHH